MEDRGTPITQCPTISKNPLDLYRLYIFTKDRGGFLEVRHDTAACLAGPLAVSLSVTGPCVLSLAYSLTKLLSSFLEVRHDTSACLAGPHTASLSVAGPCVLSLAYSLTI